MIHFTLRCAEGHQFEAWFRSSAAFDAQAESGLLECPSCGGTQVAKALMAPRIRTKAAQVPEEPQQQKTPESSRGTDMAMAPGGALPIPPQVRAVLQKIRAEVEKSADYVGPQFAEEARRIHGGEQPHRAIYGEATADEVEALTEDGIEVARIPWVSRAES